MDSVNSDQVRIHQKGFGLKHAVEAQLEADYRSPIVEAIRASGNRLLVGDLTFRLAKEFGFCYGVERAVDYAYETRKRFPDRRIFLTTELIHNPRVNQCLRQMGIGFLNGKGPNDCRIEDISEHDVVIIAAFGTRVEEMDLLKSKGCILVDATCGSVVLVWKRVEQYARDGFTAVVHGNHLHEETRATVSRVSRFPQGRYLVVWDKKEAQRVCDFIRTGKGREDLEAYFEGRSSFGFDPDRDLKRVGMANQTTMLSSESLEIAQMFRAAFVERYGEANLSWHFRSFDTICSATQDRQDAILDLVKESVDLVIVIGGFNSSNTSHLSEIASQYVPTFHIDEADCILSAHAIRHKPVGQAQPIVTSHWLPDGAVTIGLTAGASTPNRVIGETVGRIAQVRGYSISAYLPSL
jgi:4-hydroxy-3-methylbut-2-enyl diphosphate reductase